MKKNVLLPVMARRRFAAWIRRCTALLLAFTLQGALAAADPNKVLRVALEAMDEGFDPVRSVNYYSGVILEAVGQSLLSYDYLASPAKLVPEAAESLPEVSDGGKTYTFRIRKGVYFAPDPVFKGHKRELTAADFAYSFKRFMDPKLRSQWKFLFDGKIVGLDELAKAAEKSGRFDYDRPVAGFELADRHTLRIHLTKPDYNFAYYLAMSATVAVAREVVEGYKDDLAAHPVGTNAYMLKDYQRGRQIVLEVNPFFKSFLWDFAPGDDPLSQKIAAAMKGKEMPRISRIEINYIEEEQSKYLAFLGGQLDYVDRIGNVAESWRDGSDIKAELKARGIFRQDSMDPEITYTYLNFRDPQVGGNSKEKIALRRAIYMSYDTEEEVKVIRRGLAVLANMAVPRGVVGYNPDYQPVGTFNPAAANLLLDRFGYKRGADGWRTHPDGSPLLLTYASEPQSIRREYEELWRKSLQRIGIRMDVKKQNFAENLKAAKQCQLQFWASAWHADIPDGENFLQLAYGPNSGQSNNSCYDSPVYNKLYELSLTMPDSPKRRRIYELMNKQMEYDGAWKFGITRIRSTLLQPWTIGYHKHPNLHAGWKFIDIDAMARSQSTGGKQ